MPFSRVLSFKTCLFIRRSSVEEKKQLQTGGSIQMRLAARIHHFRPLHLNAEHLIYCPLASRPCITSRFTKARKIQSAAFTRSPAIAKSSKRTDGETDFLIERSQKQTYPQIYVKSAPLLNGSNTPNYATVGGTVKICHRCNMWPATCPPTADANGIAAS